MENFPHHTCTKESQPKVNNDYRPVALTSIVMKCFERIIVSHLLPLIKPILDPHQFTYRANRSVDDATLTLVHHLYQHLDTGGHHARVLMVDFSSAFNTIQPHLMMQKMMSMALNPNIMLWIQQFLTGRLQRVCLGTTRSGTIRTNRNQKSEILYLAHWPTIISAYKYTYNVNGPWAGRLPKDCNISRYHGSHPTERK